MRESLILANEGNNDRAVLAGLRWLAETAVEIGCSGLVAVETYEVLETVAGRLFGASIAARMRAGSVLLEDARIETTTAKKAPYDFRGPVFALYPSSRLLDKLDQMRSVTHLLVLPWTDRDTVDWVQAWHPAELGSGQLPAPDVEIADPIVRAAMRSLVMMINTTTGIGHPSDKRTAIETFRTLSLNGVHYDPDEIRAWLVGARKMTPKHADDVRDLAQRIADGRTVRGAGPARKNAALFRRWVEKSQEPSE